MAKKKAIKLATASAIAASAFVAAAPAQTDAASNVATEVSKAVTQIKKAYHTYSDVTATGKFADIKSVYAEYNAAKTAYNNAKALVNKAGGASKDAYLAQLDSTYAEYISKRVVTYIDAYNYAVALDAKKEALEAELAAKDWDGAEKLYHEISYELKTRTVILDRVYGKSTRELLRSSFKADAQAARDSIANEVTVKIAVEAASKLVAEGKLVEAKAQLDKAAEFTAKLDKDSDFAKALATEEAKAVAAYEAKVTPAVASVTAVDATRVEVKFNVPVKAASLFVNEKDGAFKAGKVSLSTLAADNVPSGLLTGKLSTDGRTLTITSANPLSKRYDALIDGLQAVNGKDVAKYSQVVTFDADKTAPSILGTEKTSASTVKVKFSEPMKAFTSVTFKYADGTAVTGVSGSIAEGATEAVFTMDNSVTVGKEIVATLIGAQDKASNLLTPNPATVTFVKGNKDGVAPTVSTISQTGAKTFSVKFSEELLSTPAIAVAGNGISKIEKDSTDPTLYNVTVTNVLDGTATVSVSSFTDLSGEAGTSYSKVVSFVKETAAPKVASSAVVADATSNKQYLEVTFDKDVLLSSATVDAEGSYVKDYVTTAVGASAIAPTAVSYKDANNKKVVRVELDAFLGTTFDVENAAYNLTLTFSGVTSAANVAADTAKVSFTRGKDGVAANTDLVKVNSVAPGADNNKVAVTFDRAVDGASATNAANYVVDGAVVESVTLLPASGGTQVAVLNLKAGSNAFTGTRNIYVSGVKALGSSKVMETYHTNTVSLNENVAPVVTSAKLTATNQVTLTFSEAVTNSVGLDFEVLIGGQSQTTAEKVDAAATTAGVTTLTVSINSIDATELSKGIALKGLSTLDLVDAAGNKVSVPANIVVSN